MAREGSLLCLYFMPRSLEKRCRLTFANRRCSQFLSFQRGSRWKNASPKEFVDARGKRRRGSIVSNICSAVFPRAPLWGPVAARGLASPKESQGAGEPRARRRRTPHGPNLGAGVWLKSCSSATHVKFAAMLVLPLPRYFATLGKTQSGRVI
jgi:hypothetical protein